jgi:hypothetical protein
MSSIYFKVTRDGGRVVPWSEAGIEHLHQALELADDPNERELLEDIVDHYGGMLRSGATLGQLKTKAPPEKPRRSGLYRRSPGSGRPR